MSGTDKKVGNETAAEVSAYRVAIYFRRFRHIAVGLYVSGAGSLLDHPVGEHWTTTEAANLIHFQVPTVILFYQCIGLYNIFDVLTGLYGGSKLHGRARDSCGSYGPKSGRAVTCPDQWLLQFCRLGMKSNS